MTTKKHLIITALALLGVVSCTNKETLSVVGGGELRIVFNTGDLATKTDPPSTPPWEDGSGIYLSEGVPDLVILVADAESGTIIGKYPDNVNEPPKSKLEANPTSSSMSVSITGLGLGGDTDRDVIVYAFANTRGLWAMESGGSPVTDLLLLSSKTEVENLVFSPLGPNVCPVLKDIDPDHSDDDLNRLPLSAKGTTKVSGNGNGEVSLEMLRCVAKVTAEFVNNTGAVLTMYDFHNEFVGMCPTSAYVMSGNNPDSTGSAGNIVGDEASLNIAKDGTQQRSWYVFPSIGPYTCNIDFWLDSTKTDPEKHFSYSSLEVHDDHARDLTKLKRNQHLHIVTRISKGLSVSFSFQVMDWEPQPEEVFFH